MGIMDNEGHDPMGFGNVRSETRDKIAAARERQLAAAVAERDQLLRVLRGIAEYCSGDSPQLGAIKRLIAIRNTALQALRTHEQAVDRKP